MGDVLHNAQSKTLVTVCVVWEWVGGLASVYTLNYYRRERRLRPVLVCVSKAGFVYSRWDSWRDW